MAEKSQRRNLLLQSNQQRRAWNRYATFWLPLPMRKTSFPCFFFRRAGGDQTTATPWPRGCWCFRPSQPIVWVICPGAQMPSSRSARCHTIPVLPTARRCCPFLCRFWALRVRIWNCWRCWRSWRSMESWGLWPRVRTCMMKNVASSRVNYMLIGHMLWIC